MKHKKVWFLAIMLFMGLLLSCGTTEEERKRIDKMERLRLAREDSAAFKVAVLPTLDCLPVLVAKYRQLYDTTKIDLRLKEFSAQMDCDTALMNGRVEAGFSDLVRVEKMRRDSTQLEYLTSTNLHWQLISNRLSRVKQLKQMDDKMIAMTRHSATDLLSDLAVDSAKLKDERVYRVQINDVNVRLKMLENNEMDMLWMPEPQATTARALKNNVLLDTRKLGISLGVLVVRKSVTDDKSRAQQLDAFKKAYNAAVDSINKNGVGAYEDIVIKYCATDKKTVAKLPKDIKYKHIAAPDEKDVERAKKYTLR